MKYTVKTEPQPDGKIVQSVITEQQGFGDLMQEITRYVIDTRDEQIKAALNQLGWHHRDEFAALDVPNPRTAQNPLGSGFHRVFINDIAKMEEQIRQIAKALHL